MTTMFVRSMLFLGVLALILALIMLWGLDERADMSRPAPSISPGKPVGTSTLSHGGPPPVANPNDSRDAVSH